MEMELLILNELQGDNQVLVLVEVIGGERRGGEVGFYLRLILGMLLIDSLHYARTCSTYLVFSRSFSKAMCIILNA
jgi:hypothetical protein